VTRTFALEPDSGQAYAPTAPLDSRGNCVQRILLTVLIMLACLSVRPALAQDTAELEAYVDGIVTTAMEDHRIPGVVVAVVKDGGVLLEKGYGFAREPDGVAADPVTSLFRVASISKTFNATALMQLVEQGRVDLDAPFTDYLPDIEFRLPLGVPRVRDLITHSAGFEEAYFGHFWARDAVSDHTLAHYVSRYQPVQVREPGKRVVYSNYGTSVVGLIIERVSGQPYADYLSEHVLRPIGMHASRFGDWHGPDEEPTLAHAYNWSNGRYKTDDWAWQHRGLLPAGGLVTTAREMTYFMRAHLGDGSFGGGRLLQADTLARMHRALIANHDAVTPNAHGFWAAQLWGYPTLQHGGSIFGFMSNMVLVPELGLGIFVSTNSPAGLKLSTALPRRIVAHFHSREAAIPTPAYADADAARAALEPFSGEYLPQRRGYTTLEKAGGLIGSLRIGYNDRGFLTLTSGGTTQRFAALDADRFASPDTGEVIAFSRDEAGRPALLHNAYGHNNFDRIGWFESGTLFFTVAGLLALAMLLRLVGLWLHRRERLRDSGGERLARWATVAVIPVWVAFGWALTTDLAATDSLAAPHFASYPTTLGWVWVTAGLLGAALSMVIAWGLLPVWRQRNWSTGRRVAFTLYASLGLLFAGLLHQWNLLGLRML
jgi:CubicO group peptidase (beta-lactamase class C family)